MSPSKHVAVTVELSDAHVKVISAPDVAGPVTVVVACGIAVIVDSLQAAMLIMNTKVP